MDFNKIFDEWLWQEEKTFNPFTRYIKELESYKRLPNADMIDQGKRDEYKRDLVGIKNIINKKYKII